MVAWFFVAVKNKLRLMDCKQEQDVMLFEILENLYMYLIAQLFTVSHYLFDIHSSSPFLSFPLITSGLGP